MNFAGKYIDIFKQFNFSENCESDVFESKTNDIFLGSELWMPLLDGIYML